MQIPGCIFKGKLHILSDIKYQSMSKAEHICPSDQHFDEDNVFEFLNFPHGIFIKYSTKIANKTRSLRTSRVQITYSMKFNFSDLNFNLTSTNKLYRKIEYHCFAGILAQGYCHLHSIYVSLKCFTYCA